MLSILTINLSRIDSLFFFFQAEDGIRDLTVTGVQTCALPISCFRHKRPSHRDPALVAVAMVDRRPPELLGVPLVGPVGPPDVVRRAKLNDARKIADRHG